MAGDTLCLAGRHWNIYAKVAQSVEHSTENAGVGGSIPPLGTTHDRLLGLLILLLLPAAHISFSVLSIPMYLTPAYVAALDCISRHRDSLSGRFWI